MPTTSAGPTIAVIGAGLAGRAFALRCAQAGFRVTLEDVMPDKLRHAREIFASLGADVVLVDTVEDAVRDADLVVDFVPDELESKLEIWSMIDRMAPPQTVMCTPSDVLSITDLASCTYRRDRCVMLRGDLAGGTSERDKLHVLTSAWTSPGAVIIVASLLQGLGIAAVVEHDPDLPQLLKNMNAPSID